ncbi:MAG TPA: DUF1697 domain-containing protein, partial [Candidatus Acidoferrales bacterium]|nr:DUF1697 domain-containing protein [Candidatus Acidoferrales bacterium]
DALAQAFAAMGFKNVRTLLASGNVLFEAPAGSREKLAGKISGKLAGTFGHEMHTILRTMPELRRLADAQPFGGIKVTPRTRLFVTFLPDRPRSTLKIPYTSPDGSFCILCRSGRELCSVLTLGPQWAKNLRQMDILEKEFGKRVTTRSWNTVVRILRAGS